MTPKTSFIDRAICAISPERGLRRLAARGALHQFRYEGAEMTTARNSAPQNISPNSFDVQRDRLQLMREAEDLERNFAPAKHLNRKYALYTAPVSYHAQTEDHGLNRDVEEYLNLEVFPNVDVTGRYDFFKMMEFGIMGMNRGGDYGWAFLRPDLDQYDTKDLPPEEVERLAVTLPLKIQAVEPDRIGGIYQNVVSNDYVSGCIIGKYGAIDAFRVFHRSMTTSVYDAPVDIPASQFVHMTDPMRIDQYRGVSILATAVQNLRDLYEIINFAKGKIKLSSALTVFTNSNGAIAGAGAMDAYQTNLGFGGNGAAGMQQDINFGQINHLAGGTDIKFPASNTPSNEEMALMTLLLKFVAMSYNLPYSFALDAAALGGVSSRLESEMAKAEFERGRSVVAPHAHRIKNAFLIDAIAKGVFPARVLGSITKGRWGYRPHPQPDLGREATAAVNLFQTGLLNPLKYWIDDSQDPEDVANDMARWAAIKQKASAAVGMDVQDVFGAGMAKPVSKSESITESTTDQGGVQPDVSAEAQDVQQAAVSAGLNGAQVSSLNDLATKVAKGEMPMSSAKAIASAAFPSITPEALETIFAEMADFIAAKQAQTTLSATPSKPSAEIADLEQELSDLENENARLGTFDDEWSKNHVAKNKITIEFLKGEINGLKAEISRP